MKKDYTVLLIQLDGNLLCSGRPQGMKTWCQDSLIYRLYLRAQAYAHGQVPTLQLTPPHPRQERTGKVPLRPHEEHHQGSIESRSGEVPPLWCLEAVWLPGSLRQSNIAGKQASRTRPEEAQGEGKPKLIMLPYVADVSEKIRKACRNYNIKVAFRQRPSPHREASGRCVRYTMHVWKQETPRN